LLVVAGPTGVLELLRERARAAQSSTDAQGVVESAAIIGA
jgi:hypothetical protein